MSIQDIAVSQTVKKKLLKITNDENVLFQEETGELIVNVAAYNELKAAKDTDLIEEIIGEGILDTKAQFYVFS
ncbi:MAG: hypothetical protein KAG18_03990 [Sinobacterium sp.]|nr:hypothetical protein [Sinobacterium sp.]